MKTAPIQQEIVLVMNTTLSNKQWTEKDITGGANKGPATDRMEEACWNGLLDELLPEIIERTPSGKPLYLWQIRMHDAIIDMELSEYPGTIDKEFSIDPHLFLQSGYLNG
jgi:hypothetical protein